MKSKKVKVLHLFNNYLQTTESWLFVLLNALNSEIHIGSRTYENSIFRSTKFHYMKYTASEFEKIYKQLAWRKNAFKKAYFRLNSLRFKSFRRSIIQYVESNKIEIIHAHFAYVGYEVLSLKKKGKIKLVVSFYGWDYEMYPSIYPSFEKKYQSIFKYADKIIVEGPHGKKTLIKKGCSGDKIIIVPLGIEFKKVKGKKISHKNGDLKLVQIASFREKKGQLDAVQAIKICVDSGYNVKLDLVGNIDDELYYEQVKAFILKNNLSKNIMIIDFIKFELLNTFLQNYHAFIHPSCYASNRDCEGGAPTILFHALAAGLPIISTNHCDIPYVVKNNVTGKLVQENNAIELSSAIIEFYLMSDEKYNYFRENAINDVKNRFDIKINSSLLDDIYVNLVS